MTHIVGYNSKAQTIALLVNATATSASAVWPGGEGKFHAVSSNWNTANASLQFLSDDGSTWLPFGTDTSLSANGAGLFTAKEGDIIRVAISGAVPVAMYASVTQV